MISPLSQKTLQVVKRFAECKNSKEIASELYIRRATVDWHIKRALTILALPSREHLTHWAMAHGIAQNKSVPIQSDVLIPTKTVRHSPIQDAIRSLLKTGDSVLLPCKSSAVWMAAKFVGIKVIIRRECTKKQDNRCRVWRSDGKTMAEVNAIIQSRTK